METGGGTENERKEEKIREEEKQDAAEVTSSSAPSLTLLDRLLGAHQHFSVVEPAAYLVASLQNESTQDAKKIQ